MIIIESSCCRFLIIRMIPKPSSSKKGWEFSLYNKDMRKRMKKLWVFEKQETNSYEIEFTKELV